jgi:hypothetical protein
MAPPAPGRRLRPALLATLALGLSGAPLSAQQTGTPAMQHAVDALARALKEKSFDVLSPYLDDGFHVDALTGAFARQVMQQAVTAGAHVPTAVRVESLTRQGGLVHATTRFEYPDTTRTVALVLTEAGRFVEIPLVHVQMTAAGGPPPNAVGGMRVSMGGAPPAMGERHAGPPPAPSAAPAGPPPSDPALRDELLRMRDRDQELRNRVMRSAPANGQRPQVDPETARLMAQADSQNLARLREIVARHGWPGSSLVGADGSQSAFLVLQHADAATQEHYLPMVRQAAARHELAPSLLATLEDRVRVRRGEKQVYGTQLRGNEAGRLELFPLEDEAHVDARRASVGLPPLADYLRLFGLEWSPPAAAPR